MPSSRHLFSRRPSLLTNSGTTQTSSVSRHHLIFLFPLRKPDAGDGGKENNKSLANDEGSQKPPLRKTAINPFLKKSPAADVKEEPKQIQEKNESASDAPQVLQSEEVKDEAAPAIEVEGEKETAEDPEEELAAQTSAAPSTQVKPSRERKKKGKGRRFQSSQPPLKPILVNDDEVRFW